MYLKVFAQESLGRPDMEIGAELNNMQRFLSDHLQDGEAPDVQAALIFTNEKTEVEADDAPVAALQARKLKDFIRKTAKNKPISQGVLDEIKEILPK